MTRKRRRLDQALHDRAELLSRSHSGKDVAAILGLTPAQVSKMKGRGWKPLPIPNTTTPPTDFAIMSARMTRTELCAHYKRNIRTIGKWFAATPGARESWRGDNLRAAPTRGPAITEKERLAKRLATWDRRRELYGPSGHRARPLTRAPGENDDV